jgi:hypothetical protein
VTLLVEARGAYCMPMLPAYPMTHQWVRELRRCSGQRLMAAVDFHLSDDEMVYVGHYRKPSQKLSAAEAAALIHHQPDARGWEIFIPRRIHRTELRRLRRVDQVAGWRYEPNAHGRRPCPFCMYRGEFKAADIRNRFDPRTPRPAIPQLFARLERAQSSDDIIEALRWFKQRRPRAGAEKLTGLMEHHDPEVREFLAETLISFRDPAAKDLLATLQADPVEAVRHAAQSGP